MVLVVVLMHAVAAYEMQVRITHVQLLTNGRDMPRVTVIVNRVSLLLANDTTVHKIAFFGQADLNQLAPGELDQIVVARIP